MDEVNNFLKGEGFHAVPEYFSDSEFLLGQRIENEHFTLIYRQEGERLILCSFSAKANDGQAVRALVSLLRRLTRTVKVLRYMDALILPAPQDAKLHERRQRLAQLLVDEGAKPVEIEGELWLRYHC